MWIKHEAPKKPARRTLPAVRRRSTGRDALLVLPCEMITGPRADVFSDGDRLGFRLGAEGDYPVQTPNPRAATRALRIPGKFAARLPVGTTDIAVTHEDGMIVLDLATLIAA